MSAREPLVFRAPLFVQMFALIVASLAAGQAISLAIVYVLPPPPPAFFRVSELATALQREGGVVTARNGRPLQAVVQAAPDKGLRARNSPVGRLLSAELAEHLKRAPGDIRLVLLDPERTPARHSIATLQGQFNPEPSERGADHFVVAPFEAAVRRADGRWTVLRETDMGFLATWRQRLLLWFSLSALALAPVTWLFARRLAAPLAIFAAAAERLGRDPRAPPLSVAGSPEIARAVGAFNGMQERLRRYVDDRTAMIGAIAHDLRTPLTRLRFRAEAAPVRLRAKMNADIDEMEQMIAAVMAFVRDASHAGERRPLDLQALVAALAEQMADTGLCVAAAPGPPVTVDGDALALRRLAGNLLNNAVKFGGGARARVHEADGCAVLEIEDDGPGVPDGQAEAMFEPFRRAEPSRSRQTGGAGLGLAVVRTVARAHGGDAELENRPEGGLRARVRIPLTEALPSRVSLPRDAAA